MVLYRNDNEYKQHSSAIHSLAEQYHVQEPFVREIYEETLKTLQEKAKFRKYLTILVSRQVQEMLKYPDVKN